MAARLNRELARYELESYAATETSEARTGTRQVNAVEKMSLLPEKSFDDLVIDVVNELHRRKDMPHLPLQSAMQKKLYKIKDEGFRSLVMDVLAVLSQKSVEEGSLSGDVNGLIDNIDKMIISIKKDMESEERSVEEICSEDDIIKKTYMFISHVRCILSKNGEDTFLAEHMMDQFKMFSDDRCADGLKMLLDIDVFLKKCNDLGYERNEEYKYHRDNIERLLHSNLNSGMKKKMIADEAAKIYSIVAMENTRLKEVTERHMRSKINEVVEVLCSIRKDVQEEKDIDVSAYAACMVRISKEFMALAVESDFMDQANEFEQLNQSLETLENMSKGECYDEEPLLVMLSIAKLVKVILAQRCTNQMSV
ncbi:hypothetical protein OCOL_001367 [Ordospora colligata]|uniref:GIT Spa2 homology (SHD) domain-containing protein n=1 Tax=Ordospora colligata OC4 TaxID=1354746 RepID=A0A0B2ULM7_9MICR|nr:uncharacterized protein M896_020640 [Ordospora colligata OC4]KHN70228.1 hypothetical protein M896_020640 [Ordospora colligata OC4]TBU16772.1 hypothetical protein CWI41_020650 [Ordospora colligata]TBU17078.1 hypothetical protein CWI40_020650 [Ordospora colligata]